MRILGFIFAIIVFFSIYGIINCYIGLRGWNALIKYIPFINRKVYWTVFWFIVAAYPAAQFGEKFLSYNAVRFLTLVGSYWLAAMYYLFMIIMALNLLRLLDKWVGFIPEVIKGNSIIIGVVVLILVVGILVYGSWNALNPRVSHYEITVEKKAGSLEQLHLVMVSDIHLGSIVRTDRLNKLAEIVNERQPDLIMLAGDIVDQTIEPPEARKMVELFGKMEAKQGKFAVPGNHEYISGYINGAMANLKKAGFHVLRDSSEKVAGSFYVVGRDDKSGRHMGENNENRKELSALMEGIDKSLPVILLDHQPVEVDKAQELGVDLQLSGHTHNGQLFPNNFITGHIYDEDWGLLKKENLHFIVSSGYGTWGPPIRIGNYPEIVDVLIKFK